MRSALKALATNVPIVALATSAVRARQQEGAAAKRRAEVEHIANQRGVRALTAQETLIAVRKRLRGRAEKHGWPKAKGSLHLFVAFRIFDWEAVLLDAFREFGEVTVFEWSGCGFDSDGTDWWEKRPAMNAAMCAAFDAANARRPVDAVIGYISRYNTMPETLEHMAAGGAAIFNFSYDDKLEQGMLLPDGAASGPTGLAGQVDLNLTSDPTAHLKYALHGGLSYFHPEAADPQIHRPYDVPFDYDVTFVGAKYGMRPHFIDKLRKKGINVVAMGRGWPGGALPMDRMVEIYSRSRINLGFGGIGHSQKLMCLKGRDFEVVMSGGLYLTQANPELELVFDVGREIVTYRDVDDCADKIRDLLSNPIKAAQIRAAGRVRCLAHHSYDARWSNVFEVSGIMIPQVS